jgi:hypothetical protein
MTQEKHKSQRSVTRLFGQSLDPATGQVTGAPIEVRIAYPFLHEKRTKSAGGDPLDKPRHDAVLLIPKLNADATKCPNYAILAAHCMEAATKAWGNFPQGGKWPIQDGDQPHQPKPKPGKAPLTPEQVAERNKWRVGNWIVEVANYLDPGPRVCVLQNGQTVEIPAKVVNGTALYKSGDYGYVSLNAYSFSNKTFGVNFGFEGVMFTRPGEAIGSSGPRSAAQMFGSVAGMAPAIPSNAGAPAPAPVAPPQVNYAPPAMPPQAAPPVAPAALPPGMPQVGAPPMPPAPAAAPLPPFPGR